LKALVTGAAGLLGRALVTHLEREGPVIGLDRSDLDISSKDAVREALGLHQPDIVINAAAFTDVDGAETQPDSAHEANTIGPGILAEQTCTAGTRVLTVSTDYVFDGNKEGPYDENDAPSPLSVYGRTKLAGEEEVRRQNPQHFIVRTAWLYDTPGECFAQAALGFAAGNREVRIAGDQRGSPTFVPHLAGAIARLILSDDFGTHHIAGSGGASRFEFVRELYCRLGIETPLAKARARDFPSAAERPANSELTTARQQALSLPPWKEGVAEFARRKLAAGNDPLS
jgi:dTDP-4-dehydrorhamnose reductase